MSFLVRPGFGGVWTTYLTTDGFCSEDVFGKHGLALGHKPTPDSSAFTRGGNSLLTTNVVYELGQVCYRFHFKNQVHGR